MMPEEISVRQWQEMFQAGKFHQDSLHIQKLAGWDDFYDPLNSKDLQNLSKLVTSITHPFVLDNYRVYFLHHTPVSDPMFGCVYFDLLSDERSKKSFYVALDSPHERKKWALTTRRYGDGAPEFECGDIRRMTHYINDMAHELEQDIQPAFIAEKQAVNLYASFRGEPVRLGIYREGNHRYSYTSLRDGRIRTAIAVSSLKDAPPDFAAEQAEQINGLYVYSPEDYVRKQHSAHKSPRKSQKRKEPER